jgi:amino-acid N-acetyltransferase
VRARRARQSDARAIHQLIAQYAEQGLLLPRGLEEIRRKISHFVVFDEQQAIVACLALEPYGPDLAEIRSLAVDPSRRGGGIGGRLLQYALEEARRREIGRVFAVTHAPEFFLRYGFAAGSRHSLTEKIERDCCSCAKRRTCQLFAVVATVIPDRAGLPVLDDSAVSISA